MFDVRMSRPAFGVLIARGLAEESGQRVRLSTKAIVGATSKGLSGQIDALLNRRPRR